MDYRTPHSYDNDPTLDAISEYFTGRGERLQNINTRWDYAKIVRDNYGSSFDLEACLKWNDFSQIAGSNCFITLNSDGRYHNRTPPLIYAADSARNKDFSVVIKDAHPDYGKYKTNIGHSADFVGQIERMENVKMIYLLGVTPYGLATSISPMHIDYEVLHSPKIEIYLSDDLETLLKPETSSYRFDSEEHCWLKSMYEIIKDSNSCKKLSDFNPSVIPTEHVYLSTDMDVVRDFKTRWRSQGNLSFQELLRLAGDIANAKKVFGADICGLDHELYPDNVHDLPRMYKYYSFLKSKMKPWKIEKIQPLNVINDGAVA